MPHHRPEPPNEGSAKGQAALLPSAHIYPSDSAERDHLDGWLRSRTGTPPAPRFEAYKGTYVLHYPLVAGGEHFVLRLSDRQDYGKFGS